MLNFDRSTVKHGTQNIQNDCHQWLSDSFRVQRIRFRPGLCAGPHWGELNRFYRSSTYSLRGIISKWGGDGEREEERERMGTGNPPPFRKFLDPPLDISVERNECDSESA